MTRNLPHIHSQHSKVKKELSSQAQLNKIQNYSYYYFAPQIIVYLKYFGFVGKIYIQDNPIYLAISGPEICWKLVASQAD